jgi:hypothetical protein
MRCSVCDYCQGEAGSVSYSAIRDPKGKKNRVVYYNKKLGREICNFCDYEDVK